MQSIVQPQVSQDEIASLLRLYYYNPKLFAEQVLDIQLDDQQVKMIEYLYEFEWETVRSGKGPGKTFAASVLIWHFLITRALSKVFITAPAQAQMTGGIWTELSAVYNKLPSEFRNEWEFLSNKIVNKQDPHEWFCHMRVARKENPEALRGAHGDNLLYVMDEATGIPDESFETVSSTLTGKNNYLLLMSNPNKLSGFFYESHLPKQSTLFKQLHFSCFDSSFVDPKSIEKARLKYGKESGEYRCNVLGEFPLSETDSIILADWVREAMAREVKEPEGEMYWGVDVATTSDRSVLIKRKGNKVYPDIRVWRERDTMKLVGRIVNEYKNTPDKDKPYAIFIDDIAIGKGPADRLKELHLPIVGTNASKKAVNSNIYVNLRAEMWFNMQEYFRNDKPDIPNDPQFAEELYTMKSEYHSSGRMLVEEKLKYRRRNGGKSPDKADALALTFNRKKMRKASESLFFI